MLLNVVALSVFIYELLLKNLYLLLELVYFCLVALQIRQKLSIESLQVLHLLSKLADLRCVVVCVT